MALSLGSHTQFRALEHAGKLVVALRSFWDRLACLYNFTALKLPRLHANNFMTFPSFTSTDKNALKHTPMLHFHDTHVKFTTDHQLLQSERPKCNLTPWSDKGSLHLNIPTATLSCFQIFPSLLIDGPCRTNNVIHQVDINTKLSLVPLFAAGGTSPFVHHSRGVLTSISPPCGGYSKICQTRFRSKTTTMLSSGNYNHAFD